MFLSPDSKKMEFFADKSIRLLPKTVTRRSSLEKSEAFTQRCSVKKSVLENSAKFTGLRLFLLKKRLWHRLA